MYTRIAPSYLPCETIILFILLQVVAKRGASDCSSLIVNLDDHLIEGYVAHYVSMMIHIINYD